MFFFGVLMFCKKHQNISPTFADKELPLLACPQKVYLFIQLPCVIIEFRQKTNKKNQNHSKKLVIRKYTHGVVYINLFNYNQKQF